MSVGYAAAILLVAAASIAVALTITPTQQVTVLGEEVSVGTVPSLSLSGPGQVDLFGERLPTAVRFAGPVRPRLALTHVTLSRQLASAFGPQSGRATGPQLIGKALASGWVRYFAWEVAIAGGCALVLAGAIAGWARRSARRTAILLAAGLVVTEVVNLGGIMVTAYTAPARLRGISSLTALVGQSQLPPVPEVAGAARADVKAVVIGDSTAAGLGLPGLAHPGKLDRACHRSKDAYAADLAAVNNWQVLNLACSGATIPAGLLGRQQLSRATAPAQLATARKVTHAAVVIVSVGANNVGWSGLVRLCAMVSKCDNSAATAYFQQQLAVFSAHYYQLLGQLAGLPSHPPILINLYYDPFDTQKSCLEGKGLSSGKEKSLLGFLHALNKVLAEGARVTSQVSLQPDFAGHALCDPGPYVQGAKDPAPFHPTAAGQLAIALADEQALQRAEPDVSGSLTAPPG